VSLPQKDGGAVLKIVAFWAICCPWRKLICLNASCIASSKIGLFHYDFLSSFGVHRSFRRLDLQLAENRGIGLPGKEDH
jgi:hypothetical protein